MGILGIFTLLAIAYAISNNRKKINYRLVVWGLSIQIIFALIILVAQSRKHNPTSLIKIKSFFQSFLL